MFEDFENESEYTGTKKISFAKVVSNNQNNLPNNNIVQTNNNANPAKEKNVKISNNAKREDKINFFKNIVSEYIKDKELNMYYTF